MKCENCGVDLEKGILFCKQCGHRVVGMKRYCRECGNELDDVSKFCKKCGAPVSVSADIYGKSPNESYSNEKRVDYESDDIVDKESNHSYIKESIVRKRNKVVKTPSRSTDIVVALIVLLLVGAIVFPLLSNWGSNQGNETVVEIAPISSQIKYNNDTKINTSHKYAYMSDAWNVYIAVPISDAVIKIEHWHKSSSSSKKMKYDKDIGAFKLDDAENGFYWVDDEHTAFVFKIKDSNDSKLKNGKRVVFTINISDTDVCKGSDYNEKIACYAYINDDWHEYRAIQLTEKLIKIEVWSRSSSSDKLLFGYDLFLLNPTGNDTDFKWGDESHQAFTITMHDPENNYYWKGTKFVAFTLQNSKYKYKTVADYLGISVYEDESINDDSSIGSIDDDGSLEDNVSEVASSDVSVDYADAESFEAALNAGENLEGKIVKFEVNSVHPDYFAGHNVWAGEHLNFISDGDLGIKEGDTPVVRTTSIKRHIGSWFIHYEIISN